MYTSICLYTYICIHACICGITETHWSKHVPTFSGYKRVKIPFLQTFNDYKSWLAISDELSGGTLEVGPGALEVGTYTNHNKITITVSLLVDFLNGFDGARNHRIQGAVR